jgi:hypothetical protein
MTDDVPAMRLPPEIWSTVLDHLLHYADIHWRAGEATSFSIDGRRTLESITLTCRFLRELAQPLLFFEFKCKTEYSDFTSDGIHPLSQPVDAGDRLRNASSGARHVRFIRCHHKSRKWLFALRGVVVGQKQCDAPRCS